jgi:hypothetical protein
MAGQAGWLATAGAALCALCLRVGLSQGLCCCAVHCSVPPTRRAAPQVGSLSWNHKVTLLRGFHSPSALHRAPG